MVASNFYGSVTGTVATLSFLNLEMIPGLVISGPVGYPYHVEFRNSLGDTNTWHTLTNFNLPSSPYLYVDTSAQGQPNRFYRAVQTP